MKPTMLSHFRTISIVYLVMILAPNCLSISSGEELRSPAVAANRSNLFETVTPVSDQFYQKVDQAQQSIPPEIWTGLLRGGWRLQVVEFVVDAMPALIDTQPRNWPQGTTWENSDAIHLPKSRLLVLAEKRKNKQGIIVENSRIGGTFRHEVGHAFDMAVAGELTFSSTSPEFITAYERDISQINQEDQLALKYFLSENEPGKQEAFAILLGSGSDQAQRKLFTHSFPRVISHVNLLIESFEIEQVAQKNRTVEVEQSAAPQPDHQNSTSRPRRSFLSRGR